MKKIIISASIRDFSGYDERFCNNGGSYGFWETYETTDPESDQPRFIKRMHTTAEFNYCSVCGIFYPDSDDFHTGEEHQKDVEIISLEELLKRINAASPSDVTITYWE